MGRFISGDIVVLPFPFSDLTGSKRRPAFILAGVNGNDTILCQITSRARIDKYAILLDKNDFSVGSLSVPSAIRTNKLFTTDENIVLYTAGKITDVKRQEAIRMNTGF
jgi:mRNA interferase MazF